MPSPEYLPFSYLFFANVRWVQMRLGMWSRSFWFGGPALAVSSSWPKMQALCKSQIVHTFFRILSRI